MTLSKKMLESIIKYNNTAPIQNKQQPKYPNFPTRATNQSSINKSGNQQTQRPIFRYATPVPPLVIPDKKLFYSVVYTPGQIAEAAIGNSLRNDQKSSPRPPVSATRLRLQVEDLETEFQVFAKKKNIQGFINPFKYE
ncbi:hypothetical protein SS50377_20864 [Spironucleus salmonicida]|uniref:Uncharacterized protein n=1 Tax=Spironucleus salmonicida TaxID=348837 RepID=A0A9P8M046_9EUKA|nr:hypothetical protein SS50377_20864 [Spironucleus salmonicida]